MTNLEANDKAATVAEQGAPPSKKGASQKKGKRKAKKSAKAAALKKEAMAPRRARAQKGAKEERTNKKAEVVSMMQRAKGVTLAETMEATSWQRHTIRVSFRSSVFSKRSN